jgi:predicted amidohydrolase
MGLMRLFRGKGGPLRNEVGLSQEKLNLLLALLRNLQDFGGKLHDRVLRYVLDGSDESVLGDLAAAHDVAHALHLGCSTESGVIGDGIRWGAFLATIEPIDCRFYLRLGKIFEAAFKRLPANRFFCEPWFDNALWLEILLQEGTQTHARCWSSRERKTAVSGPLIEEMLKADGRSVNAFVTAAFRGTKKKWENTKMREMVLAVADPGKVQGVHHKVHLATGEGFTGMSARKGFPVFDTAIGRVGCLICMDTTVCESARMLALGDADFICFPIMGDLRADRWSPGPPKYDEDAWKAIMRTRAIDNQVCMVIARNECRGSCIINRKGDILAWNDGKEEVIEATLPAEDGFRSWEGGDFRETTFLLRRPHMYGLYTDESNVGPVKANTPAAPSQGTRQ